MLFYDPATFEVTQATGGLTQVITLTDVDSVTHTFTFTAGVLVSYTTA